jgi:hypothetical protein
MIAKVINRFIVTGMIYLALYVIYMIFGDKEIICPTFWRTYYHIILVFFLPLAIFIEIIPITQSILQKMIIWVIIIFLSELILYNIALINQDYIEWVNYCTSKVFGFIIAISIAIMLIISLIINKYF